MVGIGGVWYFLRKVGNCTAGSVFVGSTGGKALATGGTGVDGTEALSSLAIGSL